MRWTLCLAVAGTVACGTTPDAPTVPTVRMMGADSLNARVMPALAQAYEDATGRLTFDIQTGSSADGLRALLDGTADLAASSRLPIPAEVDQAKVYGWTFERHIVGLDVITVQVHPRNPIANLTWDQTHDIFCSGTVRDWSEFGLDAGPIQALVRDGRSGSRDAFEDFFCGAEGLSPRLETVSSEDILQRIASDPAAITFAPLSERAGKVLALRQLPSSDPVPPSQANAIRGRYPLTHDLSLYTAGPPSPELKAFLEWIESPAGQHEVDENWVVPLHLRAALLDEPRPLRETITFDEGADTPDDRSLARLAVLEDELRDRAGEVNHIILEGFADVDEASPLTLSNSRAQAVRDHLDARLPAMFFEIIPRGSTDPIGPTDTPLGKARSRSVRVFLAEEEKLPSEVTTVGLDAGGPG